MLENVYGKQMSSSYLDFMLKTCLSDPSRVLLSFSEDI
jgi:hypothetical protein